MGKIEENIEDYKMEEKRKASNYVQLCGDTTNNIKLDVVTTWAGTTNWAGVTKEKPFEEFTIKYTMLGCDEKFIPTKVIFNPPATICFFPDGSKVVVKCAEDEEFCEEEGVMACIIKKIFKSRNSFKKLVKNAYRQPTYGKDQWG